MRSAHFHSRIGVLALGFWALACKAYQLPSSSMEPTIVAGDYVLAAFMFRPPARKEVIIYSLRGLPYVKRVLGLPGDTLSMRDGVLVLNGRPVVEPYASHRAETARMDSSFRWQRRFLEREQDSTSYHPTLTTWGAIVLPPDNYFVLGDNRGESADSRYTGFVRRAEIFARPLFIYFSRDRQSGKIRWGRIGIPVRDST